MDLKTRVKKILNWLYILPIWYQVKKFFIRYTLVPLTYHQTSKLNIMTSMESIEYIIKNKASISRYGDGEFKIIWGESNGFQDTNLILGKRLLQILTSPPISNHIVAIPYSIKDYSEIAHPFNFWPVFTAVNYYRLKKLLDYNRVYADALLSRFYIDYLNKERSVSHLNLLKNLWNNQNILIIEGKQSRTGIGNDLYDNAKSIRRILGPSRNAYDLYDKMLEAIKRHADITDLILLSYGMTATVLAYDLASLGYWAVDIGHLDLEYEWFKMGVKEKVTIKGKFTNEVSCHEHIEACYDKKYLNQIIEDISNE